MFLNETTKDSSEESGEEFIFGTTATPTISNTTAYQTTTNPEEDTTEKNYYDAFANVDNDDEQYDDEYDGKTTPLRDLHRERFKTDILVRS